MLSFASYIEPTNLIDRFITYGVVVLRSDEYCCSSVDIFPLPPYWKSTVRLFEDCFFLIYHSLRCLSF